MNNKFFNFALGQASRLSGKPGRIILLLSKLGTKLKTVNWSDVRMQTAGEQFSILGRLTKAYALGHYRAIPWKTMLIVLAAILYFVNPLDLVPDIAPIVGLSDDFAVLVWVYKSLSTEVEKFLAWEKSRLIPL